MNKPNIKAAPSRLQEEIYVSLINAEALEGTFKLGNLTSAQEIVRTGDHLRGVSEVLAACFAKEIPSEKTSNE